MAIGGGGGREMGIKIYLAEAAPGSIEDNEPRVLPALQPEQVLHAGPAQGDNGKEIRRATDVTVASRNRGFLLLDVSLV